MHVQGTAYVQHNLRDTLLQTTGEASFSKNLFEIHPGVHLVHSQKHDGRWTQKIWSTHEETKRFQGKKGKRWRKGVNEHISRKTTSELIELIDMNGRKCLIQ